jgi:hypothetical protein
MAGEPGGRMGDSGSLSDEIRAAREALQEAGIALQTAGETLENAATEEQIAAAKEALANARIALIVAGQDISGARTQEASGSNDNMEGVFNEAEDALNEANIAIVIATNSILSSQIDLPDVGGVPGQGGRMGELDKELSESIGVFEGEILEARRNVIDSTPPPTSSDAIPGAVLLGGNSVGEDEPQDDAMKPSSQEIQQGRMQESKEEVKIASTQTNPVPEDIPSPQGDDIVAQQLREAAVAETDPVLQAKLWEELKRYRAGL